MKITLKFNHDDRIFSTADTHFGHLRQQRFYTCFTQNIQKNNQTANCKIQYAA